MAATSQSGNSLDHTRGDGDLSDDDTENEKAETVNDGADEVSRETGQHVHNAPSVSANTGSGFVSRIFSHTEDIRGILSLVFLSLGSIKKLDKEEAKNYS